MFHYQSGLVNQVGKPVVGATVQVNLPGTGTAVTIYSDDGITTKPNPMTTDSNGAYDFYVADGRYDIACSGAGITARTYTNVDIFDIAGKVSAADSTWKIIAVALGTASDVTISRTAAKTVAIGNAIGDASGTAQAARFVAGNASNVAAGATPTLDCSTGSTFELTLTASITTLTLSNPVLNQEITIIWHQNATGGFTVAYPATVKGGGAPSTAANSTSTQCFVWNGTNWYSLGAIVTGM